MHRCVISTWPGRQHGVAECYDVYIVLSLFGDFGAWTRQARDRLGGLLGLCHVLSH